MIVRPPPALSRWCLTVHGVDNDQSMPTDTARKIAAALIEAADEIDGLT